MTAVHADGRFTLALPDGRALSGIATGGQIRRLGCLIGCPTLALGVVAADGTLAVDGVMPVTPNSGSGHQYSQSELTEMFTNNHAATQTRPEATEEEMDAMIKDDR